MVEVLDLEVATEPLALHENLEVAVGVGEDLLEQIATRVRLEVLPATTGLPAEVLNGAMPLITLVDLLHERGQFIAKALPFPIKVSVLILVETPDKGRLGGGHGGVAHVGYCSGWGVTCKKLLPGTIECLIQRLREPLCSKIEQSGFGVTVKP